MFSKQTQSQKRRRRNEDKIKTKQTPVRAEETCFFDEWAKFTNN